MYKMNLFSKMSGKLAGMFAINTNPLENPYCTVMAKNPDTICSLCYSQKLLRGVRRSCIPKFTRVGEMLSKSLLDFDKIPIIGEEIARFSAHGELINLTHLQNYIRIAQANPSTTWGLWTKRTEIVKKLKGKIPDNIVMVYSNPKINTIIHVPQGFNKVFSVYSKEYAKENNIIINCGGKRCLQCRLCYSKITTPVINEIAK